MRASIAYDRFHDVVKTIELCSQAIAIDPTYARAYVYRAQSYEAADIKKACADYKEFLQRADADDQSRPLAQSKIEKLCGPTPTPTPPLPPTPSATCPAPLGAPLDTAHLTAASLDARDNDHDNAVRAVAFSSDGELIASSSWTRQPAQSGGRVVDVSKIKVFDAATGKLRATLLGHWEGTTWQGHWGTASALAFAPGLPVLASGGEDGDIVLWDLRTQKEIRRLNEFDNRPITTIAFACDGTRFYAGTRDGSIREWETQKWHSTSELKTGHQGDVYAYAFSADGRTAFSGAQRMGRAWDLRTRAGTAFDNGDLQIRALGFFLDGSVAVGMQDGVTFYELANGVWQRRGSPLHYASRIARLMAVASDNTTLAISRGSDITIWDRKAGILDPSELVLRFSATASPLGAGLPAPAADTAGAATPPPPAKPAPDVTAMAYSPRGWPLAVGYADGSVLLWRPQPASGTPSTSTQP